MSGLVVLVYFMAVMPLLLALTYFVQFNMPRLLSLSAFKIMANSAAGILAVFSLLALIFGLMLRAYPAAGLALLGLVLHGYYIGQLCRPHRQFEAALGEDYAEKIPSTLKMHWLKWRYPFMLPATPKPMMQRDVVFYTIPENGRALLCDVWQPSVQVPRSGMALIYLHGSGWHFTDKDYGTRPMFRHLTAQGHVVMDVAYRLCPETDMAGILADVKHAIGWLKTQAVSLGFDAHKVVLMGGSAGGQLALLAAYTAGDAAFTPADLQDTDLHVCGVAGWYAPSDMAVYFTHAGKSLSGDPYAMPLKKEKKQTAADQFIRKLIRASEGQDLDTPHCQMMINLMGGTLREKPESYAAFSPVNHISGSCPPTILFQGLDDSLVNAGAVKLMADKLRANGVPVIHQQYAMTEHAFDVVMLQRFSPPGLISLYALDRFLAALFAKV